MPPSADPRDLDVVAIVGSAGAVRAMEWVLSALPPELDAAVLVVLHLTPQHRSLLANVLGRSTKLPVAQALDGEELRTGRVYVAPPDAHLIVTEEATLRLDQSELVHNVRPSADVLLLSLAQNHRGRCITVVLSGTGIDGAAGAAAVKRAGGTVLAQDEASSEYFGMPGAAILAGGVDEVLPLRAIAEAVVASTRSSV